MENKDLKTPYEWCLEANIRVLDLNEWPLEWYGSKEKHYFEFPTMGKDEMMELLSQVKVKPNSTPRKTPSYLEYRMYGLVPYNISSIQGGIQYGHALQEYNNAMLDYDSSYYQALRPGFNKWRKEDKTFIILNGGTTNELKDDKWYGTLQQARDILVEKNIYAAEFKEPDLNYTLTAIVFLVDERVFNRELYPDYVDMPYPWVTKGRGYRPSPQELEKWETENAKNREKWVDKIGGEKNDFLRTWLRNFRLAN